MSRVPAVSLILNNVEVDQLPSTGEGVETDCPPTLHLVSKSWSERQVYYIRGKTLILNIKTMANT